MYVDDQAKKVSSNRRTGKAMMGHDLLYTTQQR